MREAIQAKARSDRPVIWPGLRRIPTVAVVAAALLLSQAALSAQPEAPTEDCSKCHQAVVRQFEREGVGHRQLLSCQDCHPAHPPATVDLSLLCEDCHDNDAHHSKVVCRTCHTEPHSPLATTAAGSGQEPCQGCHKEQRYRRSDESNGHRKLSCTACHRDLLCDSLPGTATKECRNCHQQLTARMEKHGGGHLTQVTCRDCHRLHTGKEGGRVPPCSECHAGGAHLARENCSSCHRDTHRPKLITFDRNEENPCENCHLKQQVQLQMDDNRHSGRACVDCHTGHDQVRPCDFCHKPHSKEMSAADCRSCHLAHSPLDDRGWMPVPTAFCVFCHKDKKQRPDRVMRNHSRLSCAKCHEGSHKEPLPCQSCHTEPHPGALPLCVSCHGEAHAPHR